MKRGLIAGVRRQWAGYLSLFLVLTGGTALAVNEYTGQNIVDGSLTTADYRNNDIRSSDIRNDTSADGGLTAVDLRPDSVGAGEVKAGSIGAAEVANLSLTGSDLASDTLGGQQIAESSLGEVPKATIAGHGGYGRQSGQGTSCTPPDLSTHTCASVEMYPSAASRALVLGRFRAVIDGGDLRCSLGSSAFGKIAGSEVSVTHNGEYVTLAGITPPLPAGTHSFGIDCWEADDSVSVADATVTAVAISPY